MNNKKQKGKLIEDAKQAILNNADLAGKIIKVLGGEISLPSLTMMVYRESPTLKKESVLRVISNHMNIPVEQLTTNNVDNIKQTA